MVIFEFLFVIGVPKLILFVQKLKLIFNIKVENMDNTFSTEDLSKAFILRDDIERKNIITYNSLDKYSKSCKCSCSDCK